VFLSPGVLASVVIVFDKVRDGQSKANQRLRGCRGSGTAGTRCPAIPNSLWADKYSRSIDLKTVELNRQIAELELHVSYRKQTSAICSNRQKMRKCPPPISGHSRSGFCKWSKPFLPGSDQNIECDVTSRKQSPEKFLPGATTHPGDFTIWRNLR
jgi:hypothetical protein